MTPAVLSFAVKLLTLAYRHATDDGLPWEIERLVLLVIDLLSGDDSNARLVAELVADRGSLSPRGVEGLFEHCSGDGSTIEELWARLAQTEGRAAVDEAVFLAFEGNE